MKLTLTIISVFFLTLSLNAQSQIDSSNIYLRALSEHFEYLRDYNHARPDLFKIHDTYFIEEEWIVTNNFPTDIDGQKIEILTSEEIIKKVKGNNSITLLAVRPVQWKNGQMVINVIEFRVSGGRRKLNYVNLGVSSFRIKCSTDTERTEIERI